MAHSTFSRTSLGMAVAIAVGITAAPAVASGPVATIVPAAHAQSPTERHLPDNIVQSLSVTNTGGSDFGGNDDPRKPIGKGDTDTTPHSYLINVTLRVPDDLDFDKHDYHYDLVFENLNFGSSASTIRPTGYSEYGYPASGYNAGDNSNVITFRFGPESAGKALSFQFNVGPEYAEGVEIPVTIKGQNKEHYKWTMSWPGKDGATTTPAPSTTENTTPTSTPKQTPPSSKPSTSKEPKPSATAQPAPTGDITAIDVDDNGNYIITANGKKYEMKVGALRDNVDNLNELVKQQRVDIAELEKKDQEVLKQAEKKIAATEKKLDALKQDVDAGTADKEAQRRAIAGISASIVNINNELNTVHAAITQLTGQDIKEVRNNGDGSFTLIRNNGEEVHGNITVDTDEAITTITTDDAGNLVVTNGAGESITVEINRTTVEESTEGDKDLVTITTPTGDVTFEVGNTYISDVVQTDDGNFDIYRNDVEGVWKSIDLSDLRQEITQTQDRVEALKKQHAKDTEEIKKQREKDATALNTRIDATNTKLTAAEGAIRALKGRATKVEKRVTDIEGSVKVISKDIATINKAIDVLDKRVTNLERHDEDWAKCYSGIGQAAIPLAFAVPLGFLAGLDLPGFDTANANLQHQIGAFNPAAAAWLDENRGGVRAAAGVLGIASVIGIIAHAATTCQDYNASDAAKDTDLAQTSSKIVERFVRTDKADN